MNHLGDYIAALFKAGPVLFGLWCLVTYKEPVARDYDWEDGEPR